MCVLGALGRAQPLGGKPQQSRRWHTTKGTPANHRAHLSGVATAHVNRALATRAGDSGNNAENAAAHADDDAMLPQAAACFSQRTRGVGTQRSGTQTDCGHSCGVNGERCWGSSRIHHHTKQRNGSPGGWGDRETAGEPKGAKGGGRACSAPYSWVWRVARTQADLCGSRKRALKKGRKLLVVGARVERKCTRAAALLTVRQPTFVAVVVGGSLRCRGAPARAGREAGVRHTVLGYRTPPATQERARCVTVGGAKNRGESRARASAQHPSVRAPRAASGG